MSPTEQYTIRAVNSSEQPIYDVRIRWYQGNAPWIIDSQSEDFIKRIMPGTSEQRIRDLNGGGNLSACGAVVEFRDAAGITWRCTDQGALEDLSSST
jgi:hypothetical protein